MSIDTRLGIPVEGPRGADVLRRFAAPERRLGFWVALWTLAVAAEAAVLVSLLSAEDPAPGYRVVFRLVGGSFVACGLIAWRRRPDSRTGLLMIATGAGLFVEPLLSHVASPALRLVGDLLEDAWGVPMIALLLTFLSGGRIRTRADRVLVGLFALQPAIELVRHLFLAREGNVLLVHADRGIAAGLAGVNELVTSVACLAVAVVIGVRWKAASAPRRRAMLPSVAGISTLLFFAAVQSSGSLALKWLAVCSLLAVPGAFLVVLLRSRLARGGLTDLFRRLQTLRGAELEASLAKTLGDPSLVLERDVAVAVAGPGRALAPVRLDGRDVAVLIYDASLDDDPALVEAVSSAAAVAIENEELRGESEARLSELRASRERIVAAGDAERRRLERNLHDGAQQRLVAVALQLRLLQSRIRADPELAQQLVTTAGDELAASLAELRELARGIHPAVLEHGLEAALDSLATRSPVPTSVSCETAGRLPEPVEFAAYFVASEALANVAKYAGATAVSIRVRRTGALASIEIADDGAGGADATRGSGLRGLADRVEALDGRLRVASPHGGGTTILAELPCA